jgi:hypothetical protein
MTIPDTSAAEIVDFLTRFRQREGVRQANEHRGAMDSMKLFAVLLLGLTTLCGCAQRYKITLHNHQQLTTSSRPKFDKVTQTYRFKDSSGQPIVMPGFRVKEIEPL